MVGGVTHPHWAALRSMTKENSSSVVPVFVTRTSPPVTSSAATLNGRGTMTASTPMTATLPADRPGRAVQEAG